jgi:hypothetical protein
MYAMLGGEEGEVDPQQLAKAHAKAEKAAAAAAAAAAPAAEEPKAFAGKQGVCVCVCVCLSIVCVFVCADAAKVGAVGNSSSPQCEQARPMLDLVAMPDVVAVESAAAGAGTTTAVGVAGTTTDAGTRTVVA